MDNSKILKNEKYVIKLIKRKGSWLEDINPLHVNLNMAEGAKIKLCVPINPSTNKLVDPLGPDVLDFTFIQRQEFAKKLAIKEEDLNIHNPKNFWLDKEVALTKEVKPVDISTIDGLINYAVLKANKRYIAPSWEERFNSGEYKFAIVSEDEQIKTANVSHETTKKAWILYGRIDSSVEAMVDFMNIYHLTKKTNPNINNSHGIDYLRSEVGKVVEKDAGGFVDVLDDDDYEYKLVIYKATRKGLLTISRHQYFLLMSTYC